MQRTRRLVAALVGAFLVATAAFAFYAAVLNGGTGTVTTQPFGANTNPVGTFSLVPSSGVPLPTNLQPGASCNLADPSGDCGAFNLVLNNPNPVGGTLVSVTLAGIDLPTGCPADSLHVIWPNGSVDGTYTEPAGAVTFGPNSTNTEVFPQFSGHVTLSSQPLLWFKDDGQNQNACAGGSAVLHFTGSN